jgi:hypothetical protein
MKYQESARELRKSKRIQTKTLKSIRLVYPSSPHSYAFLAVEVNKMKLRLATKKRDF